MRESKRPARENDGLDSDSIGLSRRSTDSTRFEDVLLLVMAAACGARTSGGGAGQPSGDALDAAAGTSVDSEGGLAVPEDRAPEPGGGDGSDDASTFARPSCGPVDPMAHRGCSAIHELTLSNPSLADAGSNRGVSPGQTAIVEVHIGNTGPQASDGPCIGVASDNPLGSRIGRPEVRFSKGRERRRDLSAVGRQAFEGAAPRKAP